MEDKRSTENRIDGIMASRSLAQPTYLIADFTLDDLAMIAIKLRFNPEGVHLMIENKRGLLPCHF